MKIEPAAIENLLKLANAYAAYHECTLANVGRRIHGDTYVFERLRDGKSSITLRKYDETVSKFQEKWPEDLPWPKIREPFRARR